MHPANVFKGSLFAVVLLLLCTTAYAQELPKSFRLSAGETDDRPLSNSAVDLLVRTDTLWVAGGKGIDMTTDNGASWMHVGDSAPFDLEDIAALEAYGSTFWASLAGAEDTDDGALPRGLGLAVSTDNGVTWTHVPQPKEAEDMSVYDIIYGRNSIPTLAVTTDINNITYDIAVTKDAVFTASFAGGLRKSTDGGANFTPVVLPPDFLDAIAPGDSLNFELSPVSRPDLGLRESLNHRVFSVHAMSDDTIWVGTAGGINLSTDGGISWKKFSFDDPGDAISGNFVVAIGDNTIGGTRYVWASTINALNTLEFRAVSYTTDMGESWSTTLRGEFTHNFGFRGDVVYAPTNSGIYRSDDGGRSWIGFSRFVDSKNRQVAAEPNCYAAAPLGDDVWVANSDGLMRTTDNMESFFGTSWTILRAAQALPSADEAYAYPNPFSPDDEVCRIHYHATDPSVSIRIYDFAMLPVRTLIRNATRVQGIEHDEIWDGKNDNGTRVANGVYYIEIENGSGDPRWTKVIVLQ
ncbi:MAG: hypothetical protein C0600_05860 [Ignavibacteria bacterium]|nr:MAG: hypothetical protein C0600_05860 [Ignavibacteria bacterium]